ncbi:hypothetical protein [uncultured Acetatifactor sp.]|uniref:hypothetical protein n=1 Tax=uncultured Acetatifactor sp. TaxID=1671927 RepID=UPI0026170946|nr:hypothetical protein [uncultured Acetatifactor sp.]
MFYIVTEDKNSARDFWEAAVSVHRSPGTYMMVPLIHNEGGNTTLLRQVQNLSDTLMSGDELLVVFDYVKITKDFNPYDLVANTESLCAKLGVKFYYTKYYCFEEVLLSYEYISDISNTRHRDVLEYVNNCINANIEYFDTMNMDKRVKGFIAEVGHHIPNKEHFANELLVEATKCINGHFRLTKRNNFLHSSGECWIDDCEGIRNKMNEHQAVSECGKCSYACKNCTDECKIRHLEKHSLLQNWD